MNLHLLFHVFFSFSISLLICEAKTIMPFQKQTLSWVSHEANRSVATQGDQKIFRTLGSVFYVYMALSSSKINKTFDLWFTSHNKGALRKPPHTTSRWAGIFLKCSVYSTVEGKCESRERK